MRHSKLVIASLAVLAGLVASPGLATRLWNRPPAPPPPGATPQEMAMDYVHIMDFRDHFDLVSVQWMPPLSMKIAPEQKAMFDRFVIIAVSHVSLVPGSNSVATHQDDVPAVLDGDDRPLAAVSGQEQPDALRKFLDDERSSVGGAKLPEAIGPPPGPMRELMLGYLHNLRFFAFRAGALHECTKGRLTVRYAGVNYTFDTPLPGCTRPPAL